MTDETRGEAIKRRRLHVGIKSYRRFWQLSGIDRETVAAAERDEPSVLPATYDAIEAFLTRYEEAAGEVDQGPAEPPGVVEVEMFDVYGVGRVVARGRPDEVADSLAQILEGLRRRESDGE